MVTVFSVSNKLLKARAEIHQAQFSLLEEFFNGKLAVKDSDNKVLMLVNAIPGHYILK